MVSTNVAEARVAVASNTYPAVPTPESACIVLPFRMDHCKHLRHALVSLYDALHLPIDVDVRHVARYISNMTLWACLSAYVCTSPGCIASTQTSAQIPSRLFNSAAICRSIWLRAALLAAYAPNPSSKSRNDVVDPESDEMNTTFDGGASGFRSSSFRAQTIGPIVFV